MSVDKPTFEHRPPAEDWLRQAQTLSEALPYMRRYAGATFVIKYGGHAMGDRRLAHDFARDVVLLKQVGINPVVVHGGGPQIGQMLTRLGVQSQFVDGLRVTDQATVDIVEMVLAGSINKSIVGAIQEVGGKAIGLCGKDGNLLSARKLTRTKRDSDSNIEKVLDLGFVGEPHAINGEVIDAFKGTEFIPVIAPIGMGPAGETYNINADTAAGALAGALNATRLFLLTDVAGVFDANKQLIDQITGDRVRALIQDGTISGGMIPKIETCLEAVESGVEASVILDGRVPHAVLLEVFTEGGAGTLISRD
jgi:acetylglutamate kinase